MTNESQRYTPERTVGDIRRRAVRNLEQYLENPEERLLRAHQMDGMSAVYEAFKDGYDTGYINLPTGSGKTPFALELIKAIKPEGKTLIISPTLNILEQTHAAAQQFSPDLEIVNYYSREKDLSGEVINTTYQSLPTLVTSGKINPSEIDLMIFDEAHTSLGRKQHTVFRQFPQALMVGLTATPYFQQLEGYKATGLVDPDERWVGLFTNELYEMTLEEGIERGILSHLDIHLLQTETQVGELDLALSGDYNKMSLEKYINQLGRNYLIVAMIAGPDALPAEVSIPDHLRDQINTIHDQIQGKKVAVFGETIRHIEKVTELLQQAGISAASVHSQIPPNDRERILKEHRHGETQVVSGVDMLRLGWDSPETTVGIYAAPTRSGIVAVQELGRILRPHPESGKERAIAIQLVDDFQFRYQAPILIPDIFDPEYILRGTQTGLETQEKQAVRVHTDPNISYERMEITAEKKDYFSRTLLRRRLKKADLVETQKIISETILSIQEKIPNASVFETMRQFADSLPYHIPMGKHQEALEAIAGLDTNRAQVGREVFLLLNIKPILNSIKPFLTEDPDENDDLLQVAFTAVSESMTKFSGKKQLHAYIYNTGRQAVFDYIRKKENISIEMLRKDVYRSMQQDIDSFVTQFPLGMSEATVVEFAETITERYGIHSKTVVPYMEFRWNLAHPQNTETDILEKDIFPAIIKDTLEAKLRTLSPREKRVLEARFGLSNARILKLEELGKEMGLPIERIRQVENTALRKMRHPSRSRELFQLWNEQD